MDSLILVANVETASVYSKGGECHVYQINWE